MELTTEAKIHAKPTIPLDVLNDRQYDTMGLNMLQNRNCGELPETENYYPFISAEEKVSTTTPECKI
jgi:hypothetical protein